MEEGWVVLGALFSLRPGDPKEIDSAMRDFSARRKEKQPLEYPSARQMIHLKNLLESFDWWNLTPVIPGDPVFRDASGAAVYARTSRVHLLYFYGKETRTGRISGLASDAGMEAQWYDPRTGRFREAALPVREADGYWSLPPKPDEEDWVLEIIEHNNKR